MLIIALSLLGASFIVLLVYISTLLFTKDKAHSTTQFVSVDIIVAARNEEANIERCIQSLLKLDYPVEKLSIFIGNDMSEDKTGEIITKYAAQHPHLTQITIQNQRSGLKGKTNVLAQLIHQSSSDYIFITDADISVPTQWVQQLLSKLKNPKVGMISGTTLMEGRSLFDKMQQLDWTFGMGVNRAHEQLNIPVTGVGNNMAFKRAAYESLGGYEKLGFSVIEDYLLFKKMCEEGEWEFRSDLHPDSLCISNPVSFKDLLKQRQRWFKGARILTWYNLALLTLNTLVVPALIVLAFYNVKYALICYGIKLLQDFIFLFITLSKVNKLKYLLWFPIYEVYYQITSLFWMSALWIPVKVKWKGRVFE